MLNFCLRARVFDLMLNEQYEFGIYVYHEKIAKWNFVRLSLSLSI